MRTATDPPTGATARATTDAAQAAARYLRRAYENGRVTRSGRGLYTPLSEVSGCPNGKDTDTTPNRTNGLSGQPRQDHHP